MGYLLLITNTMTIIPTLSPRLKFFQWTCIAFIIIQNQYILYKNNITCLYVVSKAVDPKLSWVTHSFEILESSGAFSYKDVHRAFSI